MKLAEIKRKISAKIAIHCGRAMSRLFYKFPISTDPFKFCEIQLLDDDDLDTMMKYGGRLGLECRGTSQIPENSNYGGSLYNNHTPDPHLQIHPEVIMSTEADVREMTNNGEDSDQDIEDFIDPNIDKVPDDIDDEGLEGVEDVHSPSFSNPSRGIVLQK
ncbi:hypothetical protein PVK06_035504 [Gossypium arboreum]|uniref:Uncharacterized protein n=1 Tax=Gossypium arboreum TaxID=29729 RepID=A0ABR0NGY9_GOSAR|nr:hypothetical protein PVK06_035504 [Gossypium arboreum]